MTSLRGSPLLERDFELRQAGALLSAAAEGDGGALVVEGPAGIGKSTLLREIRGRAERDGFVVLTARGAELERGFSFGVVRQLFEAHVRAAPEGERERLLSGAAHLALAAIGDLDPAAAPSSPDDSFAVLHGLYWLTSNLAEARPLVIAVDDAHWSDVESLRFLDYLAGRLEGSSTLLVVGARPFEPGSPASLLTAIDAEDASHVLRPAPLTETGTEELVRALLEVEPGPGFAAACREATGGNPQLIHELLAALAADGVEPTEAGARLVVDLRADRIAASILARVGGAGIDALSLARAVAVLGRDATPELAAALAGLETTDAARAADGLAGLEILMPGAQLGFVHPIVRTAVYNDFGSLERGQLHAQAARLLSRRGADPESVCAQLTAAPPAGDEWAMERLREADGSALARGAPSAAAAYLDRALAEGPPDAVRSELLLGLGRANSMLGDARGAIPPLREALDLAGDSRSRVEILHVLFKELAATRAGVQVIDLLERELAALGDDEHDLGLLLESDIDTAGYLSLPAKRAAAQHLRRFDDPNDPGLQVSTAMDAALYGGTADLAAALALDAVGPGRLLDDEGPESPRVWAAASAVLYSHRLPETVALADAWLEEARRRGSVRGVSLASSVLARATHWMGDLAEAEGHARAVLEGMPEAIGLGRGFLAEILIDLGEPAEAQSMLAPAERAEVEIEWSFFLPSLLIARGAVALSRGEPERGARSALAAGEVAGEWGIDTPGPFQWRPLAAESLTALGEHSRAAELMEAELEVCARYGSPRATGIATRVAGRIDLDGRGLELLTDAAHELGATPARLEQARALIDLGAALRRAKRATDARDPLREGLAHARACGARPLAERAHEELVATGARPRKIVRAGTDALTSSERRVARMAADGMTNKEIAQDLFVTVRTVEAHLHHTYQKLEISSRTELARALDPS